MILQAARKVEGGGYAGDVELSCLNCGEDRRFVLESDGGAIVETGRRGGSLSDARAAAMAPELWRVKQCARCGGHSIQVVRVDDDGVLLIDR